MKMKGKERKKGGGAREEDGGSIASYGREVVSLEIEGLSQLKDSIGPEFEEAVRMILECSGKVIVCGIGKSGIVARKIAATLSSTGTPAVFLHPVEAAHGDMGMVTSDDIFLAVSKSGGDEEFSRLLPYLKQIDVRMISITGAAGSLLAHESDISLLINAGKEACPMDIVPTTSTTVSLALGDALAVAVLRSRDFGREDFARLHPSGILGKRLLLRTSELMHRGEEMPLVKTGTTLREALFEIVNKRLGCTGVVDGEGKLVGMITDGDLKRILIKDREALERPVDGLMTKDPRTTRADVLAVDALEQMEMNRAGPITQLFVLDDDRRPAGIIHIHDILRAGLK